MRAACTPPSVHRPRHSVAFQSASIMATVSCIVITTLIAVSLANLMMLTHVIMQSSQYCAYVNRKPAATAKGGYFRPRTDRLDAKRPHFASDAHHPFIGALVLQHEHTTEFVCATVVVGRSWALASHHCWDSVKAYPLDFVKLGVGGFVYDVDECLEEPSIVLLKPTASFKGGVVLPVAGKRFKYQANQSAELCAWTRSIKGDYLVEVVPVRLASYKVCEKHYKDSFENGLFCVDGGEERCYSDSGRVLLQGGALIGVVSYDDFGCDSKPNLFWKMGQIEAWVRSIEKSRQVPMGVIFHK